MGNWRSDVSSRTEVPPDAEGGDARTFFLNAVPTDVWCTDADGLLCTDLPAWRRHTGQVAEAVLGYGWLDAVRADVRDRLATSWRQAVAAGEGFEQEFPIVAPDGSTRVVVLRARPVVRGAADREWVGTVGGLDPGEIRDLWDELRMAETLRRVSTGLVSELDLDRVVALVSDAARDLVGACVGAFASHPDDLRRRGFPMPADAQRLEAAFRAEGPLRIDDAGPDGGAAMRSYLAVPVASVRGDVLGALFFGHPEPGAFTARHERLVAGITAPAAIAIDNARLYRAAQAERRASERLAMRLAQMQAVSARLAGAREIGEVAEVMVSGVAGALACARASLYTLDAAGERLCLLYSFGSEGRLWDRWRRIDPRAALPAGDALRERRLVLIGGPDQWGDRYPDAVPVTDRSVALAVLPLALGERTFGVVALGWDHPRVYEPDEVQFLEALAGQCSQALERARLYELERETATTLQHSLLPAGRPDIPGMDVAAVYRAGDHSVAVGGDFYDVFRMGPNQWGIAMGDVCGRGARAAARTALVRYTVRAIAMRGEAPVEVVRQLNSAMLAEPEDDDRFCAAVFGEVELDRCGAWVTLVCAGHPRPFVVRRAGWIDQRGQAGSLVGVFDTLDITDDRVGLGPGDSLVLFTDGIAEARNAAGEQFGDEELSETLLASAHLGAEDLAEAVRASALEFSGGTLSDDMALLVVRVPPEAGEDPDGRLAAALGRDGALTGTPGYPMPHGGQTARPRPPREARMRLQPHPTSARSARQFLAGVLASWRMPGMLAGDAALLLSELATNAILHARSPFTVIVRYDGDCLRVEVGDGSRAEPRMRVVDAGDAPGGRGLMLIDSVARRWGILPTARGKRVWFELPVPPPPF